MIVGGKQRAGVGRWVLVYVLHDCPGYGYAVICGGAASKLVKEHQAAGGQIVQDAGGLGHLDHEGGFTGRYVIAGSHAGEYAVHKTDACAVGRYVAAHLGKQGYQCGLTQEC